MSKKLLVTGTIYGKQRVKNKFLLLNIPHEKNKFFYPTKIFTFTVVDLKIIVLCLQLIVKESSA